MPRSRCASRRTCGCTRRAWVAWRAGSPRRRRRIRASHRRCREPRAALGRHRGRRRPLERPEPGPRPGLTPSSTHLCAPATLSSPVPGRPTVAGRNRVGQAVSALRGRESRSRTTSWALRSCWIIASTCSMIGTSTPVCRARLEDRGARLHTLGRLLRDGNDLRDGQALPEAHPERVVARQRRHASR